MEVQNRDGDELSKLATRRLTIVLRKFEAALREARFARRGLPADLGAARPGARSKHRLSEKP